MQKTLYRKYRPQDFYQVFGQESIVKVLQKQVQDGSTGHAYLFAGPRGTGKTTMARLLAKAVNCKRLKKGNPCRKCSSCLAVERGRFLDMIEIDAASNRGIDEIRRLREKVNFAPSEGKFKIYIIDEVHMLTKDAFNALLKTLEEPPVHVIFILATTEPYKIPSTILSRCQRFNFILEKDATVLKRLKYICKEEGIGFEDDALMTIVKNAGGSFRDSESILEKVLGGVGVLKDRRVDSEDVRDILGLVEKQEVDMFVQELLSKNSPAAFKIFDRVVVSGANIFQFLRQCLEVCRELLVQKVVEKQGDFTLPSLLKVVTELSTAESQFRFTQVKRLPIEVAIVKICLQEVEDSDNSKNSDPKDRSGKKIQKVAAKAVAKISKRLNTSVKKKKRTDCVDVKIEDVIKSWDNFIAKVKPFNHHLSAFFQKARPAGIENQTVLLKVPFKFHKQCIEKVRSQKAFSKISEDIWGQALSCFCEVEENLVQEAKSVEPQGGKTGALNVLGDMFE